MMIYKFCINLYSLYQCSKVGGGLKRQSEHSETPHPKVSVVTYRLMWMGIRQQHKMNSDYNSLIIICRHNHKSWKTS